MCLIVKMDDESISTTFRLSGLNFYVGSFEMNGEESVVFGRERSWSAREIESTYTMYYYLLPTHRTHHVSEGVVPAAN